MSRQRSCVAISSQEAFSQLLKGGRLEKPGLSPSQGRRSVEVFSCFSSEEAVVDFSSGMSLRDGIATVGYGTPGR